LSSHKKSFLFQTEDIANDKKVIGRE